MPCWYYDKKDLDNTPSIQDAIPAETEARYRREGAKFIIDTGTKMGLRYDTTATGVVYFHRFYMFHSFREYHRHVMAACCLFLAGKVEETPKKCKDLMRIVRSSLSETQFAVFGEDAREEVITLERILLQTIKFDLQVQHPYSYLLKYAKMFKEKGDSEKVQKMVQMAWTFINDSLCTTLCLQWEPDIIAVALMYLASRLSKLEVNDWAGRPPGFRGKWWEFLAEDANLELLEEICHSVLDLYSTEKKRQTTDKESPPPPPPPKSRDSSGKEPPAKRHKSDEGKSSRSKPHPPQQSPAKRRQTEKSADANRSHSGRPVSREPSPRHDKPAPSQEKPRSTAPPLPTAPPSTVPPLMAGFHDNVAVAQAGFPQQTSEIKGVPAHISSASVAPSGSGHQHNIHSSSQMHNTPQRSNNYANQQQQMYNAPSPQQATGHGYSQSGGAYHQGGGVYQNQGQGYPQQAQYGGYGGKDQSASSESGGYYRNQGPPRHNRSYPQGNPNYGNYPSAGGKGRGGFTHNSGDMMR